MSRFILAVAIIAAVACASSVGAREIVYDAEQQVSNAQHVEEWKAEDAEIEACLDALLPCRRVQWAAIDCTGDGPTALYGPGNASVLDMLLMRDELGLQDVKKAPFYLYPGGATNRRIKTVNCGG
jgi:hypothetical protein